MIPGVSLALTAVLLLGGCLASTPTATPGAPFVSTPEPVVDAMLELLSVKASDVLYDLGSGDGRIVITAAQRFAARGFGVELDPHLVQQARDRAFTSGVSDRVVFEWGDLFEVDMRPATAVTLYLGRDLNLRVRPKLLRELRPGARVVSYQFGMGDWEPDRQVRLSPSQILHLWVVPADVAGTWRWSAGDGRAFELMLTQQYQRAVGRLSVNGREAPATAALRGDELTLTAAPWQWVGRVSGDAINGTLEGGSERGQWTARRQR